MPVGNALAIVARVRDRNPMEVAYDLGHRFGRLLPYGYQPLSDAPIRGCECYGDFSTIGDGFRPGKAQESENRSTILRR